MQKDNIIILLFFLCLLPACGFAQQDRKNHTSRHVGISGNLSASATNYSISGMDRRRQPFSWLVNGYVTAKIYGISIPFSAVVSEQQRTFRQPFNQYGISPKYKWITIHAGYRSIHFSDYTLAGATFLGGGIELQPGLLRVAAIYGRFQKAVGEDTLAPYLVVPAFKRMGYAFKMGFGSRTSFVDFILFKAKDDTASLRKIPQKMDVLPAENLVAGVNSHISFGRRIHFNGEIAASAFSRDIRAPEYDVGDNPTLNMFKNLFTVRTSSHANTATKAALRFDLKKFYLNVKYNRIDPDYQTLGAYYFNTDVENITLAPALYLLHRKLNITTSIGRQRDNLNNQKLATTKRTIGSLNIAINPNESFFLNMRYGNYNTNQAAGIRPLTDTTHVQNISQNFMLAPRINLKQGDNLHLISLVFSMQSFIDQNPITKILTDSKSLTISPSYSFTMTKSGFNIAISGSNTNAELGGIDTRISSANLAIGGRLAGQLMTWSLAGSFAATYYNQELTNQVQGGNLMISYAITKSNNISLNMNAMGNVAKSSASRSFTEITSYLTLSQRF